MMLPVGLLLLALSLTASESPDYDDTEHVPCYKDLCVSRRQFCSESEQRCKYCEKVHCLKSSLTPKRCEPICPDLLNPATTTKTTVPGPITTLLETLKGSAAPKLHLESAIGSRENVIELSAGTLIAIVMVVVAILLVMVALIIWILHSVKKINTRLAANHKPAATDAAGRLAVIDDQPSPFGSKSDSGNLSHSSSSTSNSPGPTTAIKETSFSIEPPVVCPQPHYTARPNSQLSLDDHTSMVPYGQADSLRHDKGYTYHLLPPADRKLPQLAENCGEPLVWQHSDRDQYSDSHQTSAKSV